MQENGLQPYQTSEFLDEYTNDSIGNALSVIMEGVRPFLVEIQSLITKSNFGYPKRTSIGININRLHIILAILARHAGINLDNYDVYIRIAGGLKTDDMNLDLAIAAAIISSYRNISWKTKKIFCGEIGLTGHIKPMNHYEKRIESVKKIGITKVYGKMPKKHKKINDIEIIALENIKDLATSLKK
jgi:DNA repair protein RadA/Sms